MTRIEIIETIQKVAKCGDVEAREISKTINQQFSNFYWNEASHRNIVSTVIKAARINRMIKALSV